MKIVNLTGSNILNRIQLGGERNYGWGRMHLQYEPVREKKCFEYNLDLTGIYPQIIVPREGVVLAHTYVEDVRNIQNGIMEPLVGRTTGSDTTFGNSISQAQICWIPGSTVREEKIFQIQPRGMWR